LRETEQIGGEAEANPEIPHHIWNRLRISSFIFQAPPARNKRQTRNDRTKLSSPIMIELNIFEKPPYLDEIKTFNLTILKKVFIIVNKNRAIKTLFKKTRK